MRFTRIEILFIALGAGLGAIVAAALRADIMPVSATFQPFVVVLLGLGVLELLVGLATGRGPGQLIAMPARILAFAIGIATLFLIAGRLA